MQLGQAQVVRSNWYDRSVSEFGLSWTDTLAPHSGTDRDSYTVPANRVVWLGSMIAHTELVTVGASNTESVVYGYVENASSVLVQRFVSGVITNNVGDKKVTAINLGLLVPAGYKIHIRSAGVAVGGTVYYRCNINGNEYDA